MSMPQPASSPGLLLRERCWYGWQAIGPGGLAAPWRASPIFAETVTPLKTGQGLLAVRAVVLLRPFVPRRLDARLRVRWRDRQVIIADWQEPGEPPVLVAISEVDLDWVKQHCAAAVARQDIDLIQAVGDDSAGSPAQACLSYLFGATPEAMLAGAGAFRAQWSTWPKPLLRTGTVEAGWGCRDMAAYRLLRGFVPRNPEDKWYIYREGDHLVFQRVATGIEVWRARITVVAHEVTVRSLTVLLDRRHYGYGTPADELARFDKLVRSLLLGEEGTPPHQVVSSPCRAAAAWRPHLLLK